MEGHFRGSWPGGPRRTGPAPERTRPPQLQRVEDIEARIAAHSVSTRRRAKRRRVMAGLAFSLLLAGAIGWAMGLRSHASLAEITAAQAAQSARDADISSEINRVMLELWRMEDVEYSRNSGGIVR